MTDSTSTGRGPERPGSGEGTSYGKIARAPMGTRFLLALGYVLGDRLLYQAANNLETGQPETQAQACLHWVLNDALTGSGKEPLGKVMEKFRASSPDRLYIPTAWLSVPRHYLDGQPVKGLDGQQYKLSVFLELPVNFAAQQLKLNGFTEIAELLMTYGARFMAIPESDKQDLTRRVAQRMYMCFDHGKNDNWLLSEKAIKEALEGPAFGLPQESRMPDNSTGSIILPLYFGKSV